MSPDTLTKSAILALFAFGSALAQPVTGLPAFGSFSGGPFDTIDNANLNVHFEIPIVNKTGVGMPFVYSLAYDSSVWQPVPSGSAKAWVPTTNWGWTTATQAEMGSIGYTTSPMSCTFTQTGQVYYWNQYTNFTYSDASGGQHYFPGGLTSWGAPCGSSNGYGSSLNQVAVDKSGYTLTASAFPTISAHVVNPQGTTITPGTSGGSITDSNGNQISVAQNGNTSTFTDTLGATPLTVSGAGTATSPVLLTYTNPSGGSSSYQVNYLSYTIRTAFGCSGVSEYGPTAVNLVSSIGLPDGTSYSFVYEQQSGYYTGRIASVTLSTGGTIAYIYSGGNGGINCSDGSTAGFTRTTPDGVWKYAQGGGSTTITDPQSNVTGLSFQGIYETQRAVAGLSNTQTIYQWPSVATVTTVYPGAGIYTPTVTTMTTVNYNTFGLPTQVNEYAYGPGYQGSLVRETATQYNTSLGNIVDRPSSITVYNGSGVVASQTSYLYDTRGNLTSVSETVAGTTTLTQAFTYFANGNVKTATDVNGAVTTYTYANCGSSGNAFLTKTAFPLPLSTQAAWNCNGAVQTTSTDANGQTTTVAYTDPNFWRPTSAVDPIYLAGYTAATTNINYATSPTASESALNFNGNGSTAATRTTLDGLGRVHVSQRRQAYGVPGTGTYDSVETDYDSLGRPSRVTVPYSAAAPIVGTPNSSAPATTTTYDALDRPLLITDGGGGTTTFKYNQNDVLVVVGPKATNDNNTKQRQLEYDALGRLTSVCEMTTAVGSGYGTCGQTVPQSGLWTTYTYDTLDNLLTITQNAQAALSLRQIHTYTYDDLGRMTSEQNPETAGATYWYSYDTDPGATCPASNGDLVKRLDPANNVTCYAYDALHRTTAVTYRSGPYAASTPSKYFVYDTATVGGVTMANAAGRLAEAFTGSSSSKSTDLGFSYSTRGEVTDVYQTSPSLAGAYYHVNALYSVSGPEGLIQALSVPNPAALPSWTYNPDTEGRVGSVMAGPNNYGPMRGALAQSQSPVVSSVAYNYASQVTNVTFGSGDSDAFTYDSNTGRMTQYAASVSALPSVSIAVNGQQSSTNYYCTDSFIVTVTGAPMTPVYVNQNNGGTFQAGVTGPSGVYTASGSWNSTYVGTYTQVWSVGPTAATATAATPTLKFTVTATPPSPAGPLASVYGPGPSGELTWNANGSLAQLSIVDPLNLANNGQTCNHVYDDLGRVSQVLCVTGNWDQAFTYDPFGNIYKSQFGWYQNGTFQPTYKPGTNQYLSLPGGYYPQYDANGSLTYDVFHHYSWDAEGKLQQLDPGAAQTTLTYDALGRRVEQTNASGTIEILYGPDGSKLALMSGLTGVVKAFVPLPAGATAVYNSTGRLAWYRHSDWLGSSRISSTPTRGVYYDAAYSPYGESYDESGTADRSFTGQNQDLTPAGDLYDFSYRQYSAPQSRWISPDPAGLAAIDLTNPQSCNAYAYVGGSPLDTVDPLGLDGEINGSGPGGSAGGSIWGIFSFFLDLFTGDLGGGSSGGVQTVKKPTTPTHAPTRSKPTTPPPGSRPCGANQRRFFNWLDNSTIRGMATDLGTTPTIIFTLAAKEGGWQASDLNHNIPLQNPFGVNSINRRGQAAGNKKYLLLKDAVFDWRHNVAAAPYVHGIKDAGSFVDTLLAHGYNANRVAYRSAFMSINGSMPGHMADCGVKP